LSSLLDGSGMQTGFGMSLLPEQTNAQRGEYNAQSNFYNAQDTLARSDPFKSNPFLQMMTYQMSPKMSPSNASLIGLAQSSGQSPDLLKQFQPQNTNPYNDMFKYMQLQNLQQQVQERQNKDTFIPFNANSQPMPDMGGFMPQQFQQPQPIAPTIQPQQMMQAPQQQLSPLQQRQLQAQQLLEQPPIGNLDNTGQNVPAVDFNTDDADSPYLTEYDFNTDDADSPYLTESDVVDGMGGGEQTPEPISQAQEKPELIRELEYKETLFNNAIPGTKRGISGVQLPNGRFLSETEYSKEVVKLDKERKYYDTTTKKIKNVIPMLYNIKNELAKEETFATGFLGKQAQGLGGTPADKLQGLIDGVVSNLGFDNLKEMRDASPTGGALGNVSNFETQTLQSTKGSFKLEAGAKVLGNTTDRVLNDYYKIADDLGIFVPDASDIEDIRKNPQLIPEFEKDFGIPASAFIGVK
jgi:hypothetical protein